MRAVHALVLAGGLAAGCAQLPASGVDLLTLNGPSGVRPAVAQVAGTPKAKAEYKVLDHGSGPSIQRGQMVVTHMDVRVWGGLKPWMSTWDSMQPTGIPLDGTKVSRAIETALLGRRPGSRVVLVTPAAGGFGAGGQAPTGVAPTDSLVEVFDVIGGYAPRAQVSGVQQPVGPGLPQVAVVSGEEPRITVPAGAEAPRAVSARTLIAGTGPALAPGSTFVTNYTGVLWEDGRPFDSSYKRGGPTGFVLDPRTVPPGWAEALDGVRVGSRVLITVPAAESRSITHTQGGILAPGGRDAAYVLDILDKR